MSGIRRGESQRQQRGPGLAGVRNAVSSANSEQSYLRGTEERRRVDSQARTEWRKLHTLETMMSVGNHSAVLRRQRYGQNCVL